jgi:hypothetical protein
MVRRLLPAVPSFVLPLEGRDGAAHRAVAARNDPGWPQIRRVGVVMDAEEDPVDAWNVVAAVFTALQVPAPSAHGAVESDGTWTTGAFVLPDGVRKGSSEALLLETPTRSSARASTSSSPARPTSGRRPPGPTRRAWALAAASVPGGRPDALWDQVDPTHAAVAPLRAFLHALAGQPP